MTTYEMAAVMIEQDEHCWHADAESQDTTDPWPERTGRQGVACCSCPARGHRPITLTESKYDGFHNQILPLYGAVTRTAGPIACTGADLRDEKHAVLFANAVGYGLSICVTLLAVWLLRETFTAIYRLPHVWWLVALWFFSYMASGYLRHGHSELRRLNAALKENRKGIILAYKRETTLGTAPDGASPLRVKGFDDARKIRPAVHVGRRTVTHCQSDSDGDCVHQLCPQLRDKEPATSHRHCPLDYEGLTEEVVQRILSDTKYAQPD